MSCILSARLIRSACGTALAVATVAVLIPSAASENRATPTTKLVLGKRLYRQYCGQCHALSAALAAGFGNSGGGLGQDGGPSFNNLRVPFSYSIQAVTEPTGGHERVRLRMTTPELTAVATFIAATTSHNPIPALPTDG